MKTNPFFKNLYSNHIKNAKVFLLAGLMGGMTACKDAMEPEMQVNDKNMPTGQYADVNNQTQSNDLFMTHLSDINGSKFFVGGDCMIRPYAVSNRIEGLYSFELNDEDSETLDYSNDTEEYLGRVNVSSEDGTAFFRAEGWSFYVGGCFPDPREDWKIEGVSDALYHLEFENMSDSALAKKAKDHLESINADAGHVQHIYQAIIDGNGRWKFEIDTIGMSSKGNKIGLRHADFGLVQGSTPVKGEPSKHETFPYFGGVDSKVLQTPSDPMNFKGTAYVSVMPTDNTDSPHSYGGIVGVGLRVFQTDSAAATLSHGTVADTLTMPFNNWYTVKVITNRNTQQIEFYVENYQSDLPENVWGIYNKIHNNFSGVREVSPLSSDVKFYTSRDDASNENMSIAVSSPLYYGEEENLTTGLNNVYCAPARKSKATSDTVEPNEVVLEGFYDQHRTDGTVIKGTEISFVFGGIKQKQR